MQLLPMSPSATVVMTVAGAAPRSSMTGMPTMGVRFPPVDQAESPKERESLGVTGSARK